MIKPPLMEADEIRKLLRILVSNYYDKQIKNSTQSVNDSTSTSSSTTTGTTGTSANTASTNSRLEIYGSLHITSNNIRLLSCLIDEQLNLNDSTTDLFANCNSNQNGQNNKTQTTTATTTSTTVPAGVSSASSTSSMSPPLSNYSIISSNELNQTKLSDKCCPSSNGCSSSISSSSSSSNGSSNNNNNNNTNNNTNNSKVISKEMMIINSNGGNGIIKTDDRDIDLDLDAEDIDEENNDDEMDEEDDDLMYPIKKFKAYHSYFNKRKMYGPNKIVKQQPSPKSTTPQVIDGVEDSKEIIQLKHSIQQQQSNQISLMQNATAEIIAASAATQVLPQPQNDNKKVHRHRNRKQIRTHRRKSINNENNNGMDSYFSYTSSCVSSTASSCRSTSRSLSPKNNDNNTHHHHHHHHHHHRRRNNSSVSSYDRSYDENNNNKQLNKTKNGSLSRSRSRSRSTINSRSRSRSCSSSVSYSSAYNSKLMKLYKNYEKLKQQNVTMSSLTFLAQTATLQQQQQQHDIESTKNNNNNMDMDTQASLLSQHNALAIANSNGHLSLNDSKLGGFKSDDDLIKHNSTINLLTNNLNPNKMLCKKQQYIMMSSQSRQINNHNKNYNNIPTSSSISSSSDNILNQSEDYKLNISELKHSHRLSPISDNEPNECQINGNNKKDRIKSISPLSSSSTASSSSLSQLSAKLQLQQQQSGIVSSSSLNAVLAAAAAAGHPHPHLVAKQHHHQQQQQLHQHHQHLHPNNQHAQSVAALLADIQASQHQQQQHQQHQQAAVALSHLANVNPAAAALHLSRYSNHNQSDLVAAVIAQQQQQNRAVAAALDSTNGNSNGTNNNNNNNSNGQLYSRFSHITSNRRLNSISSGDSEITTNAISSSNGNSNNNNNNNDDYVSKYNPVLQDRNEDSVNKPSSKERESNEKIRLSPGFDVFISANDLNACNDDRGSATRLLRNLMDVFFDKSTLAKSSINGTGRITHTLDKHVISALFAYVKTRYPEVPHSQLTRAATDKCVQTRRNFRKKIKAAQSYFGMFPSM